jgi:nucleoside-diphosphate-sugar epimerase
MELDPLAAAGMALASAFKEGDALFHLAAVHNPNLATTHAHHLRDALMLVVLVIAEAKQARRQALPGSDSRS